VIFVEASQPTSSAEALDTSLERFVGRRCGLALLAAVVVIPSSTVAAAQDQTQP
jgi:hypothetical protein